MEFFNSLTLDLKMLVIAIGGCVLLALFSGNRGAEKRYILVLALLSVAGVYRFSKFDHGEANAIANPAPHFVTAPDKHTPLVSTSAK